MLSGRRLGGGSVTDVIQEQHCPHDPEAHTVFADGRGYRAEVRCRCRKLSVEGKKIRDSHEQAVVDGLVLLELVQAHRLAGMRRVRRGG